jgi:hypothetical protein
MQLTKMIGKNLTRKDLKLSRKKPSRNPNNSSSCKSQQYSKSKYQF